MREGIIESVMTLPLDELADPKIVGKKLLSGDENSMVNNAVLEVLQIRRIVEEMKASEASSKAAARVIKLTWVNGFLTLLIVLVTACGVGWNIFAGWRQPSVTNGDTAAVEPAQQLVRDADG